MLDYVNIYGHDDISTVPLDGTFIPIWSTNFSDIQFGI